MTLASQLHAKITGTQTLPGDLEKTVFAFNDRQPTLLADGTGASQANLKFSDTRTLGVSATETLDLNALTDSLGRTINFAKVKCIRISAAAGNTNNVVVGNAAATPFLGPLGGTTPTLVIPPGAAVMLGAPVNGWASTTGVSDNLKVANSGGGTGVTYDIEIIGTSA